MRLEVKVETLWESVQLDLTRGEESVWPWGGGDTWRQWSGGGEGSAGKKPGQVAVQQVLLLVRRIVGVDEG